MARSLAAYTDAVVRVAWVHHVSVGMCLISLSLDPLCYSDSSAVLAVLQLQLSGGPRQEANMSPGHVMVPLATSWHCELLVGWMPQSSDISPGNCGSPTEPCRMWWQWCLYISVYISLYPMYYPILVHPFKNIAGWCRKVFLFQRHGHIIDIIGIY